MKHGSSFNRVDLKDNSLGKCKYHNKTVDEADVLEYLYSNDRADVEELDLANNELQDYRPIRKMMENCKNLRLLSLKDNKLGDETNFEETLSTNTTLLKLNLERNQLGNNAALLIAKGLKNNTTLTELNLKYNNIDYQTTTLLESQIRPSINFSVTVMCKSDDDVLLCLRNRKHFEIQSNTVALVGISDEDVDCLLEGIGASRSLTSLSISSNTLQEEGFSKLCRMIQSNTIIEELHLTGLSLGDSCCHLISPLLRSNTTLTRLSLPLCKIGDVGAAEIATALSSNSTLTELVLTGNTIGDPGALSFIHSLSSNSTLKTLHLNGNSFVSQDSRRSLGELWKHQPDKKVITTEAVV